MVELQRNTYSWEFIFLGANIDTFSVGASIGMLAQDCLEYEASNEGVRNAHMSVSRIIKHKRRSS